MNINARYSLAALFLCGFCVTTASAQVLFQPTAAPYISAEGERWYLNGEPVSYSGQLYYPAGAQVFFNANEMVRSGMHMGVPLYVRPSQEPYSVVYVPVGRGFMQPYERPRSGEIAGSVGSTASALPAARMTYDDGRYMTMQSAGSPTMVAAGPRDVPVAVGTYPVLMPVLVAGPAPAPAPAAESPRPVATTGRSAAPIAPTRTQIGPRPQGLNAVYIQFRERRWSVAGPPVTLDAARLVRIGDYGLFPVFVDRDEPEARIYVPTTPGGSLMVPYSTRRARQTP